MAKVWRKKGCAYDPKPTSSSAKRGVVCSGTDSLAFISDATHDASSRINPEVYKTILFGNLLKHACKLIGRRFIMQQEIDPKHIFSKTTKYFNWGKSGSLDRPGHPMEDAFYPRRRRVKGETTKRGCSKGLEYFKYKVQQPSEVNGSKARCSYCK